MGRRKRKSANNHPLCNVCQISQIDSSSLLPRCPSCLSSSRRTICDSCLQRHILTSTTLDITSRVICPEPGCKTELPINTIRIALHVLGYGDLGEDYVLKYNWQGTSEQWMKRFSVRCPVCQVPIEKNGGCDHMTSIVNVFGGYPFGGGVPPQYPGSLPQQSFGQFSGGVSAPGFFGAGAPFQGGNVFPGGFPQPPVGGQFGQGYNYPPVAGPFGFQPPSYPSSYAPGQQQLPYGAAQQPAYGAAQQLPYGSAQQPAYVPGQPYPFGPSYPPGQQPSNVNPNYFGSGAYDQPRPRRSSHRRSKPRRHQSSTSSSSSSSSSDRAPNRKSPFQNRGNPHNNGQPIPNVPPTQLGGGAPVSSSRNHAQ